MALLQANPVAIPWLPRTAGFSPLGRTPDTQAAVVYAPAAPLPFRCRVGLHRWTSLALSLPGARHQATVSFCRDCPGLRSADAH